MAKNSPHSHEVAVEVTDFFIARTKKLKRQALKRLPLLSADTQRRIVQGVDREVEAKFGFPMRELFGAE